jgi:site-specific recombinase XerD
MPDPTRQDSVGAVLDTGNAGRSVPVEAALAEVLETYLVSRRARFARPAVLPLDAAMFVDTRGTALTRTQLQHLVRTGYRAAGIHDRVAGCLGARAAPHLRDRGRRRRRRGERARATAHAGRAA